MKSSKNRNDKIQSIKIIHKAFEKYIPEKQEQMKREYCLIIHDITRQLKDNNSYSDYVPIIRKLSSAERTIIFYGVPIRLSYKQFAIIRLLIEENRIEPSEYSEIEFLSHSSNKLALNNNIKSFVSKLKKKLQKEINNYKKAQNCYFSQKTSQEIISAINDLVFYEQFANGYTLQTNFKLIKLPRVRQQR